MSIVSRRPASTDLTPTPTHIGVGNAAPLPASKVHPEPPSPLQEEKVSEALLLIIASGRRGGKSPGWFDWFDSPERVV
jgi:hypothetical protein